MTIAVEEKKCKETNSAIPHKCALFILALTSIGYVLYRIILVSFLFSFSFSSSALFFIIILVFFFFFLSSSFFSLRSKQVNKFWLILCVFDAADGIADVEKSDLNVP